MCSPRGSVREQKVLGNKKCLWTKSVRDQKSSDIKLFRNKKYSNSVSCVALCGHVGLVKHRVRYSNVAWWHYGTLHPLPSIALCGILWPFLKCTAQIDFYCHFSRSYRVITKYRVDHMFPHHKSYQNLLNVCNIRFTWGEISTKILLTKQTMFFI